MFFFDNKLEQCLGQFFVALEAILDPWIVEILILKSYEIRGRSFYADFWRIFVIF